MAPTLKTAGALVSLVALASGKPIFRRQDETDPLEGLNTDVEYWCSGKNVLDPDAIQTLWEEPIPDFNTGDSVGGWLSRQAEAFALEGPNDDWADNIVLAADPNIGNNGLSECGVIGSQCQPNIDCEDWASRGFGTHYWAIQALVGFHDKLNVRMSTFRTPRWRTSCRSPRSRPTLRYRQRGRPRMTCMPSWEQSSTWLVVQPVSQGSAPGTQARRSQDKVSQRQPAPVSSHLSTSSLLERSKTLSKSASTTQSGQLKEIFTNARSYLEQLGRLATGRADTNLGDDYNFLPGQGGVDGDYPEVDNAIAQFFHDGNMLLGAADPTFNQTLEDAFSTMKPRIVD